MTPSIGVAMITHQGEKWVAEQLVSILEQSRRPDQVVISDDASTDSTLEVIGEVSASRAPQVDVLTSQRRAGISRNLELALSQMTTDVIVLADQDDIWYPDKLSIIEEWTSRSSAGGWFSDARIVSGDGSSTGEHLWKRVGFSPRLQRRWRADPVAVLLRRPVVTGATLAFRRSSLSSLLPLPRVGWHDYFMSFVLGATCRLEPISMPLIDYRVHRQNSAGLPPTARWQQVELPAAHRTILSAQVRSLSEMATRVEAVGLPEVADRIWRKIRFLERRIELPRAALARTVKVVPSLASGEYRRYGLSLLSAARDVIVG